ncbi:MAG: hypothetical protein ACK5RG_22380 [Cyclobacteriaceae bacterium]|jgi:hypothetical protein
MKTFIKIILILVALQVTHYVSYILLGEEKLFEAIVSSLGEELPEFKPDSVAVIFSDKLQDTTLIELGKIESMSSPLYKRKLLKASLNGKLREVIFINNKDELDIYVNRNLIFNYLLCYDKTYFISKTSEEIQIIDFEEGFNHSYNRKFVWFFFKWLEIDKSTKGIS